MKILFQPRTFGRPSVMHISAANMGLGVVKDKRCPRSELCARNYVCERHDIEGRLCSCIGSLDALTDRPKARGKARDCGRCTHDWLPREPCRPALPRRVERRRNLHLSRQFRRKSWPSLVRHLPPRVSQSQSQNQVHPRPSPVCYRRRVLQNSRHI